MIEKIRDDLYIQKGAFGWKIVYPIRKEQDKGYTFDNIHWRNLLIGSWANLIFMTISIMILVGLSASYVHDTEECMKIVKDPCEYCFGFNGVDFKPVEINLNTSDINLSHLTFHI